MKDRNAANERSVVLATGGRLRDTGVRTVMRLLDAVSFNGLCLQRYGSAEQGYNDIYRKYNELSAAKSQLDNHVISLQSALEEERSAKSDGNAHISELESTCSMLYLLGILNSMIYCKAATFVFVNFCKFCRFDVYPH